MPADDSSPAALKDWSADQLRELLDSAEKFEKTFGDNPLYGPDLVADLCREIIRLREVSGPEFPDSLTLDALRKYLDIVRRHADNISALIDANDLENLIKRAKQLAAPYGAMHPAWEIASDAEDFLAGKPTRLPYDEIVAALKRFCGTP